MHGISVRPATEAEAPACLALLPHALAPEVELFIARLDGAFAGAAALIWRGWSQPSGFPLAVEVLPQARRRGVGRALVAAARERARGEAAGLWSLRGVPLEGPAASFLLACGFAPARVHRHFIADVDALADHLQPRVERLRRGGRTPEGARVVPLAQAPLDELGWMLSAEFGGGPMTALHNARRRAGEGSRSERSLAAMDGDRVVGVLFCRVKDGVGVIDAWVTAPGWRGGWATPLMLDEVVRRGRADGFRDFRFFCDETVSATMKLARRCGAVETAADALFYYAASAG